MRLQSRLTTRIEELDAEIANLHELFSSRFRNLEHQIKTLKAVIPRARELSTLDSSVQEMRMLLNAFEERIEAEPKPRRRAA